MKLAIDTGGTFTDVVVRHADGLLTLHKAPTTPHDPIEGILEAIRRAAADGGLSAGELLSRCDTVIHGTTRATNAILTGTRGEDGVPHHRRPPRRARVPHGRPRAAVRACPRVPRSLRPARRSRSRSTSAWTTSGRSCARSIAASLDAVIDAARGARHRGRRRVPAVVGLQPGARARVGGALRERAPGIAVTLSHQLNPVVREYHRASAACIDASLKPLMAVYLADLESRLTAAGFAGRLLVSSVSGGLMQPRWLADAPIHSINSGPAMAPVAGRHHAEREAQSRMAIVVDAGGTSFDVSVVRNGRIPRTRETWLGDRFVSHLTGFPSVDVRTSGSGGGSIAVVDPGGLLTVGPESAGSVPGPVCYGQGGTAVDGHGRERDPGVPRSAAPRGARRRDRRRGRTARDRGADRRAARPQHRGGGRGRDPRRHRADGARRRGGHGRAGRRSPLGRAGLGRRRLGLQRRRDRAPAGLQQADHPADQRRAERQRRPALGRARRGGGRALHDVDALRAGARERRARPRSRALHRAARGAPASPAPRPSSSWSPRPATRARCGRWRCRCARTRSRPRRHRAAGRGLPRRARGGVRGARPRVVARDRRLARAGERRRPGRAGPRARAGLRDRRRGHARRCTSAARAGARCRCVGSARIAEVRGPAVLELPGQASSRPRTRSRPAVPAARS